eukprot:TRINITY_DN3364_c0_g3_i1.p1 TRINITY_DN3364_c0_g3~~TRINITY_DN3364_c0_g3_i1.p1  ORF type:complete len:107 (+),score=5.38 TRINITY_DN3364_c0_g3_i1:139-459(+)
MSKFRVRASFGDVAKNFEFSRGKENSLTVVELKHTLEKAFGETSFSVRAHQTDGSVKPLYQDAQLQEALRDAVAGGASYLSVSISSEAVGKSGAAARPAPAPAAAV